MSEMRRRCGEADRFCGMSLRGCACASVADLQLHRPRGVFEQGDGLRVRHAVGGAAADANDAVSDLEERDNLWL